jgi:hypothetical protein
MAQSWHTKSERRERTVLLSAQEYARLKRRDRRIIAAGAESSGDHPRFFTLNVHLHAKTQTPRFWHSCVILCSHLIVII